MQSAVEGRGEELVGSVVASDGSELLSNYLAAQVRRHRLAPLHLLPSGESVD